MEHFIIDCETLDTNTSTCVVIDFSAFIFNEKRMLSDNPYNLDSIHEIKKFKLDTKEQKSRYKYTVSADTLKWWRDQGEAARKLILPSPEDLSLETFATQFMEYVDSRSSKQFTRWWTRSNTFDPLIIWRILTDTGHYDQFAAAAPHWALRDTRSYIDGALSFPKVNGFVPMEDEALWTQKFIQHDSAWDILADVLRIQAILRSQRGLSI
jgi:hypothetical protein